MTETFQFRATLLGHNGWVTQIATHPKDPEIIISASRDKTIIVWKLTHDEESNYAFPQKRLYGHSHFISDIALSSDGNYALSGSWDQTLRLWDLIAGKTIRLFEDHAKEVLTVAFSADDRQIVSGSRDKTIKLWNTLAECKFTIQDGHTDWVSCVRFAPNPSIPIIVSCSWDQTVRVWNLANCQMMNNHHGHSDYLNTVSVSPDGSLCSSGGNDAMALLWDLNGGTNFCTLEHNDTINALCFSPTRYWLSVAYGPSIRIWDLARKEPVKELGPDIVSTGAATADLPHCLSLAWSTDGLTLFAGYSDNTIRVWQMLVSDH